MWQDPEGSVRVKIRRRQRIRDPDQRIAKIVQTKPDLHDHAEGIIVIGSPLSIIFTDV